MRIVVLASLLFITACDRYNAGHTGGSCYPNHTCNDQMTCVRINEADILRNPSYQYDEYICINTTSLNCES